MLQIGQVQQLFFLRTLRYVRYNFAMTETETMTTKQTCARLGISRDTLYRRIDAGIIQPIPRNQIQDRSPLKFRREDVERLAQPAPAKADAPKE